MATPFYYFVAPGQETPEEPQAGFYWSGADGRIHGPYSSPFAAQDAADNRAPCCPECGSDACTGECMGDGRMGD